MRKSSSPRKYREHLMAAPSRWTITSPSRKIKSHHSQLGERAAERRMANFKDDFNVHANGLTILQKEMKKITATFLRLESGDSPRYNRYMAQCTARVTGIHRTASGEQACPVCRYKKNSYSSYGSYSFPSYSYPSYSPPQSGRGSGDGRGGARP